MTADVTLGGPLSSFAKLQRGTTYKSTLLGKPGPYLLGLACIQRNGGFKSDNLKTYGGSSDPRILVRPGDLIVSLKDVTQAADLLGAAVRVPDNIEQGRLTQDTVKLVFSGDSVVSDYVYWLLRTPEARAHCRSFATGTTNLGLARDDFLSLQVPPLSAERRVLLEILSALDNKIELNRRMNGTLEASARALFRDWFVDYGPTRAKAEGRPAYLAPDLWSLFPECLGDDGVPEGWETGIVKDHLELKYGKSLPARDRVDGPFPVYGSGGVSGTHNEKLANGPAVIVGRKGTVGSIYWEDSACYPIDTVFFVSPEISLHFSYELLASLPLADMNTDAAVPGLNRENVYRLETPKPSADVIRKFDAIAADIRAQIRANYQQSRTLAATRDALLPKLISGEIRVRDAKALAA